MLSLMQEFTTKVKNKGPSDIIWPESIQQRANPDIRRRSQVAVLVSCSGNKIMTECFWGAVKTEKILRLTNKHVDKSVKNQPGSVGCVNTAKTQKS